MSASSVRARSTDASRLGVWELYKGWAIGLIILVIVLGIGAGLWLHFHP